MQRHILKHIREIFIFSLPLILGQIGQMLFGVGDIAVAGRYSNQVVAALGVANGLIAPFFMFGLGLTMAVGPLVGKYIGKSEAKENLFFNAYLVTLLIGTIIVGTLFISLDYITVFGFNPVLNPLIKTYITYSAISIIPALLFQSAKEFLQAHHKTYFPNALILIMNVFNVFLNYLLMFGEFGFPEMGIKGAAVATTVSRTLMFIILHLYAHHKFKPRYHYIKEECREILQLGLPVAIGTLSEVLVFTIVTVLIGKMSVTASAAHNIVLNLASLTFMIPFANSSAASVKVGIEYGAKNLVGILSYSSSSIIISTIFMCFTAIMYLTIPDLLVRYATNDQEIIDYCRRLLVFVALFQIPDGVQVTIWGIMRGVNETKKPLILSLIMNWGIGLPFGYYLAYHTKMEASGLWAGLAIGLTCMSLALGFLFIQKIKELDSEFTVKV